MVKISNITIDTKNPELLANWYTTAFKAKHVGTFDNGNFIIIKLDSDATLAFQKVNEHTGNKNRIHLDFTVEVPSCFFAELTDLGAEKIFESDIGGNTGNGWISFKDPEGNLFCVGK